MMVSAISSSVMATDISHKRPRPCKTGVEVPHDDAATFDANCPFRCSLLRPSAAAMIVATLLAALAFGPSAMHKDADFPEFGHFIRKYRAGVPYGTELETIGRFSAFKATLKRIDELNQKGGSMKHGVTKFMTSRPTSSSASTPASSRRAKAQKRLKPKIHANRQSAASIDWNTRARSRPSRIRANAAAAGPSPRPSS